MKLYNKIFVYILFICLIIMPILAFSNLEFIDNTYYIFKMENRYITEFSDVIESKNKIQTFEDFFEDRMPFRKRILNLYANSMYGINVSINPNNVIYGQNDFFFLTRSEKFHRGQVPVNDDQVNKSSENIKMLSDYITGKDIAFIFAVMPNKASIYPEYLPVWYTGIETENRDEAILRKCADSNYAFVPNLKEALQNAKDQYGDYLYHKTDTHFSPLGDYVCYKVMLQNLNPDFMTLDIKDYSISANTEGYDLTYMSALNIDFNDFTIEPEFSNYIISENWASENLVKNNELVDSYNSATLYHNENALNNKTLLYIGDSFMLYQREFMSATFESIYCFHITKSMENLTDLGALSTLIDEIQPDAVIMETVEKSLFDRSFKFFKNNEE